MPKRIIKKITNSEDKELELSRIAPSLVTLVSLCIALSAIKFSFEGRFLQAVSFLLFAGFMDGVDGRLARFLNASSDFGAQLDSLVDFVNFGIAPGFIIYNWVSYYQNAIAFEWALVLFFAVCGAIRLARFNVDLVQDDQNSIIEKYFFKGIPAPVGAAMAMLPLVLHFEFGIGFYSDPTFIISYAASLAVLMASRVPTISIKKIPIKNDFIYLTMIILVSIIIGLFVKPWLTLAAVGVTYVLSIPITIFFYVKLSLTQK
jgi:CDP-diacylglycerol--serine O-phosphatidyltransferase